MARVIQLRQNLVPLSKEVKSLMELLNSFNLYASSKIYRQ